LDRETIVVFTSDHGAFARSERRKPLRGAKADLYEGGVRVPLVLRWPGHIAAGVRAEPVFGTDLFPTLLELAGIKPSASLDGVSFRGQLEGTAGEALPRPLFWHFPHYHHLGLAPCGAMRSGRWKLVEWFEGTIGGASEVAPYELYDLESDPGESRNLAIERADICGELATMLRDWRARVGAQEMKANPDFNPGDYAHSAPPPPGDPGNPFGE
jgi:arylsulfatase A